MKKFYLKISMLAFIVAFATIPAAAQPPLVSLIELRILKMKSKGRF